MGFRQRPEAGRIFQFQEKELYMRLSHILIAGAAAVSFSAIAADDQKSQQPQAQSEQSGQQSQQSQETVKQVQEKLSAAGHEVQADGIMGPKTQAALKQFQEKQGLQASGQLDQQTLAALGVSEGASASTGSSAAGGSANKSGSTESQSGSSSGKASSGSSQESSSGSASQGAGGSSGSTGSESSPKKY
jgi:peptidoglycan hydrolase-like protein with peptidoglycan-binding domain